MSKEMMICPKAKKNCASGIKCHEEEPHLYQPKFCNPNPCGYKCIPYIPEQEYECTAGWSKENRLDKSTCPTKSDGYLCHYWQPKKPVGPTEEHPEFHLVDREAGTAFYPVEPTCPECGQTLHQDSRTDWKKFANDYLNDTLPDPRLELGLAICKKCGQRIPADLQPDKNTCIHTPPCDFDAGGRPSPCKGK